MEEATGVVWNVKDKAEVKPERGPKSEGAFGGRGDWWGRWKRMSQESGYELGTEGFTEHEGVKRFKKEAVLLWVPNHQRAGE